MAQGERRVRVHTEAPASPASPITSGQGMSLQMMTDAALIPDTIVQNKKLFYAKLSQPPDQPHLSSRVPPAQASMHALAAGSGTGWHQGPKPRPTRATILLWSYALQGFTAALSPRCEPLSLTTSLEGGCFVSAFTP